MTPDAFAQVCTVIVLVIGSLCAIGVFTAFAVKRLKRKPSSTIDSSDARLEQLQQSLDAIAIEVERISEAQRFTAQLLTKRAEAPALER